jgi:hypothetical protein
MNTKIHKGADQQKEKARRRVEGRKPSTHDHSVQPAPAEAHRRATMGPPSVATPQDFLALQSAVGNRAVQRLAGLARPGAANTSTLVQRHIYPGSKALAIECGETALRLGRSGEPGRGVEFNAGAILNAVRGLEEREG